MPRGVVSGGQIIRSNIAERLRPQSEILEPRWQGRYTFAAFAYLVFLRRSYFFRTLDTGTAHMHSVYWYHVQHPCIRQLNTSGKLASSANSVVFNLLNIKGSRTGDLYSCV